MSFDPLTRKQPDNISLFNPTGPLPFINVVSLSYVPIVRWIYPGSDNVGDISAIKALCHVVSGSMSIRVFDFTNSLTICEKTGISNTSPTFHDLGAISNLPTGQAVFEIHVKGSGGSINTRTGFLSIFW